MSNDGSERRSAERIHKPFAVRMRKISGKMSGDWDLVLLRDISKSSLSFNYNRTLQEGDLLELKISIGDRAEPITCRGEVARLVSSGLTEAHAVAVVFVDISLEDTKRIESAIEEAKKNP